MECADLDQPRGSAGCSAVETVVPSPSWPDPLCPGSQSRRGPRPLGSELPRLIRDSGRRIAARGRRAVQRPAAPEHWPDSRPPNGIPGNPGQGPRSLVLRFNTSILSTQGLGLCQGVSDSTMTRQLGKQALLDAAAVLMDER